jgi:hypothetical protein
MRVPAFDLGLSDLLLDAGYLGLQPALSLALTPPPPCAIPEAAYLESQLRPFTVWEPTPALVQRKTTSLLRRPVTMLSFSNRASAMDSAILFGQGAQIQALSEASAHHAPMT